MGELELRGGDDCLGQKGQGWRLGGNKEVLLPRGTLLNGSCLLGEGVGEVRMVREQRLQRRTLKSQRKRDMDIQGPPLPISCMFLLEV